MKKREVMRQFRIGVVFVLPVGIMLPVVAAAAPAAPGASYNVVWDLPSKDSSGMMPIGNGDIGLNVWVEDGGDMRMSMECWRKSSPKTSDRFLADQKDRVVWYHRNDWGEPRNAR